MSFSSEHLSLDEIQKRLMKQVSSIVVLSDLALTEEDYKYLSTKVKMLFKFANDSNVVDDYKLAIVVYWVFSMVYWDKEHLGTLEMEALFDGLPQYKKKYYMDICMEAFEYTATMLDTRMHFYVIAVLLRDMQEFHEKSVARYFIY